MGRAATRARANWLGVALLVSGTALGLAAQVPGTPPPLPDTPLGIVRQGQRLNSEGKQNEALALYRQALAKDPNLYQGYLAEGEALDLQGEYGQARADLQRAITLAPTAAQPQAWRALAISHAFTCDTAGAEKAESRAFAAQQTARDYYAAGETADELARIYLECGNYAAAERWYRVGHDTGLKEPNLSAARRDLWEFRLEHALARLAARRGDAALAQQHVARAAAILAKGDNPGQKRFFPYLTGYVAFYGGAYAGAIADFKKADLHDPFVLSLLAQAEEKTGDHAAALADYRAILRLNMHNPNNAFARPLAERKLEAGRG